MATERLLMRHIREILRLKWTLRRSHRATAQSLGISAGAVASVVTRAKAMALTWDTALTLSDEALERMLYGPRLSPTVARPAPDLVWVHRELRHPGVTLEVVASGVPGRPPGRLPPFGVLRTLSRLAGAAASLDAPGAHGRREDLRRLRGPAAVAGGSGDRRGRPRGTLVAVLGASNYTYAEATATQRSGDFIQSHTRAVSFFGAVSAVVVPDQRRTGVTDPCRYEPTIQRTYEDWARHYGTAIVPAHPAKPRDKSKVEVAVQIAERWILARLRHETFFTLVALNARIAALLTDLNLRPMKGYDGETRRALFERFDRPALQPLPLDRYDHAEWRQARVNIFCGVPPYVAQRTSVHVLGALVEDDGHITERHDRISLVFQKEIRPMFDQLFSRPRSVQRYLSAPLLEPRLRFLRHCEAAGTTTATLRNVAFYQCAISRSIDLQSAGPFRVEQIRAAADQWISRAPRHHAQKSGDAAKVAFLSVAMGWLRFLGRVETPQTTERHGAHFIAEYADYMRSERGLSPLTIYTRCNRLEEFFRRWCPDASALRAMTLAQIDQAMAWKGTQDGCTRASIRTYAYVLRSFFRYAETRDWCARGVAAGILPPRVYTGERLPAGPTWDHVQRLCAGAEGDSRVQVRDRAILLLFAVYGWRVGEVRRLRLEDLAWDVETIRVTRSRPQLRVQTYPLVRTVGDVIVRYVTTARPRSDARQVFLSLKAPIRPLGNSALWQIVSRRLRPLDLRLAHHGPHALRHACATHLLHQGLSMTMIGDHLGHRSPAATSVYAKVDLVGLRQVADFSLEGLA